MWLIDHSEGADVGGGCAPSHAVFDYEIEGKNPYC